MRKLGLVITDGVGYRNFILSDFLTAAQNEFDEVVIFSYLPKEVFRGLNHKIIEIEALQESFFTWFFRKAKEIAHLKRNRRGNHGIQDNLKTNYNRNWSTRGIATRLIYLITEFFSILKVVSSFLKNYRFKSFQNSKAAFESERLLTQNSCDLLFFTHQRPPFIAPLVAAAKQRKIPAAAFIFSWDNLASKGRMAANFDHYLVWSNQMKNDLLQFYSRVKSSQISIVGTPQFAPYAMKRYQRTKRRSLQHNLA